MMELDEYQKQTDTTAIYPSRIADFMMTSLGMDPAQAMEKPEMEQLLELMYTSLGLAGEAGEVANKVKKVLRGDFTLDDDFIVALKGELGDVLWYVAQVARCLMVPLEEIGQANLFKLSLRVKTGTLQGAGDNREKGDGTH